MVIGNKIAAFYITDKGRILAERIGNLYHGLNIVKFSKAKVEKSWGKHDAFIFVMAAGIVLRTIAPLIKSKKTDPAVIVLDENGKYAISLLSGHLGGANERAKELAEFLGGDAVITSSSDVNGLPSIDLWARDNNLVIEDWRLLPRIGTRLVNNSMLKVYADSEIDLPNEFVRVDDPAAADMIIANKNNPPLSPLKLRGDERGVIKDQLLLRPRNFVIGIGCNSGTTEDEIESAVMKTLDAGKLSFLSVDSVATINKKTSERGLIKFAEKYNLNLIGFSAAELNKVKGIKKSPAALKATGANAVAEPSALLAAGQGRAHCNAPLLVPKQKIGNVTVAIAEIRAVDQQSSRSADRDKSAALLRCCATGQNNSKLYIVGTGPGNVEHITPYAQQAIRKSDVIVGYGTYINLIKDLITDKKVFSTGMTQEIDRCRKAVELALGGKTVSVISGGDPGIYAMAGLVYEILKEQQSAVSNQQSGGKKNSSLLTPHYSLSVEVIPGISALNACAARLGAPLMHDFASISLSDRLTPWESIEKRLEAASAADFVIILYNPKSKGRTGHINKARDIIMKHRRPDTPVGIVKGAMREDEKIVITNLENMLGHEIDMQTTVIIGNSKTFQWNDLMITPRGYENKKR